jgi:hypothetical protein
MITLSAASYINNPTPLPAFQNSLKDESTQEEHHSTSTSTHSYSSQSDIKEEKVEMVRPYFL